MKLSQNKSLSEISHSKNVEKHTEQHGCLSFLDCTTVEHSGIRFEVNGTVRVNKPGTVVCSLTHSKASSFKLDVSENYTGVGAKRGGQIVSTPGLMNRCLMSLTNMTAALNLVVTSA